MFAMYDDDGLRFRDTIDRLYNLHQITPSDKTLSATDRDAQGSFKEALSSGDKITHEAKEKYKQITNLDTTHEIFHVQDIMKTPVVTIDDSKTVQECYELMQEHQVQQLPIRADNELHLKGMITLHDIVALLMDNISYARSNIHKHVSDIYTKEIITTDPISDIRRVGKVMSDFNKNAIPVVNTDDVLVGMVTKADIVKAMSHIPHLQMWA
ncbi:MAG: CBS domain-containing protein [Campylobacterota bacterium]|nr:CBS domain-containing protein [Campylobacterota bacterium]